MPLTRVVHKISGYYKLRSEEGVRGYLEEAGRRVLADTGGEAAGYRLDSRQGARNPEGRWRISVVALTYEARLDNARNHTLLRALGAARG